MSMRRHLLVLCCVQMLFAVVTSAQNTPNGATGPASAVAKSVPKYYPASSSNYQRVFSVIKPTTDSSIININGVPEDMQITTQYLDEMGRPLQSVIKQASPSKKDYIQPVSVSDLGVVNMQFLPYAAQTGNTNDGKFKTSPLSADSTFYKSQFSNEQIYYGQQLFDASPLNRVIKQLAPGNSWGGSNKGIGSSTRTNTTADSVRLWTIAISSEDDVPTTTSIYQAGTLMVQEVTDERGMKVVKYIDQLGRTILTKTQLLASPLSGHYGWLCTYYVYDEMNHL